MRLYDKYRPRSIDQVIGQSKACAVASRFIDNGLVGGHAFWISGTSGCGKTTIARIMAESFASDMYVVETVGRDVDRAFLSALERDSAMFAGGLGGRAWIINEAHGLNKGAIERLLNVLESLPSHCAIFFTTTRDGQESLFEDHIDAGPLLSRCVALRLTNQGLATAAAPLLRTIAQAEGLDGQPVEAYVNLMKRSKNNIRAAISAIAAGEMLV